MPRSPERESSSRESRSFADSMPFLILELLRRLPPGDELESGSSFFGVTEVTRISRLHANDGNKYDDDELLLNELVDE